MEIPIGQEIHILDLKQGEKYYGFSTHNDSRFRGIFTDYWTNTVGYKMVNFHNGFYKSSSFTQTYGPFQEFGMGIFWRVFEPHQGDQSYTYYRVSQFTEAEKKELLERCILRERRQYERGLTGTTSKDMWLPRDLVREISLRYLTDSRIGCAQRWR
jgi:hypothetical protein